MIILDMEQRSPEWYEARRGVPSASNFDKIVTSTGARSKSRDKYLYKLAGEVITGTVEEGYKNAAMEHGIVMEEEARNMYALMKNIDVSEVGFCMLDDKICGASPDGLVGDDGLVEIKCPQVTTHIEYLLKNKMVTTYFQQVQGQLFVTGRKWCDFMSYVPNMKPFIIRVERDEPFISALGSELIAFNDDLKTLVERIK